MFTKHRSTLLPLIVTIAIMVCLTIVNVLSVTNIASFVVVTAFIWFFTALVYSLGVEDGVSKERFKAK